MKQAPNLITNIPSELQTQTDQYLADVKDRSDSLMNYFLGGLFVVGFLLAPYYHTWNIALQVGGISLLAYYSTKRLLPGSDLYQYVLSAVLAIFMAQYIYQMHGLFEMHFFAFVGSAILITYQKWKLQIPLLIIVAAHHIVFNQLQYYGYTVFFTQVDYLSLNTMIIHILRTGIIVFICRLWCYQLNKSC
ncbi:MAG: sensor histidine kinase, partial [Bacteroidetes bacterium]|nr:sensor histidine kinase [Bacteroidota bacterium]